MQREQKFMADLLAVLSSEDSEDQQIAAELVLGDVKISPRPSASFARTGSRA